MTDSHISKQGRVRASVERKAAAMANARWAVAALVFGAASIATPGTARGEQDTYTASHFD